MPEFLFKPAPHEDAMDFIASKPVVSQEVFAKLLPELKGRAFSVAGIESASVLQTIRDHLASLPAGENWDDIKKDLVNNLHPYLADPEDPENKIAAERRAELLLRTHGTQAYQTAQYEVMDRQRDVFPYWQYLSMGDGRVRPSHAALNDIVLPADHEFWKHHFPPWEWGCRCQAIALSEDDANDFREADKSKPKDQQRVLDQAAQDELTTTRRLVRNGVTYNVSSSVEKGKEGAFRFVPGDLRLSVEDLRKRYDAATWTQFEYWAKTARVEGNVTVWEWMNGGILPETAPVILPPEPVRSAAELKPDLDKIEATFSKRLQGAQEALRKAFIAGDYNKTLKAEKLIAEIKQKQQTRALTVLALPESQRSTVGPANTPKAIKDNLKDGFSFIQKMTHKDVLGGASVKVKATRNRACADPYGTYIDGRHMSASTVAHELGHIIEARSKKTLEASLKFRTQRTAGESPKWLGPGYGRTEIALEDQWVKLGGRLYSGKVYRNRSGDYASEILSMGVERLKADAIKFRNEDPAYFEHVVNTLRAIV